MCVKTEKGLTGKREREVYSAYEQIRDLYLLLSEKEQERQKALEMMTNRNKKEEITIFFKSMVNSV